MFTICSVVDCVPCASYACAQQQYCNKTILVLQKYRHHKQHCMRIFKNLISSSSSSSSAPPSSVSTSPFPSNTPIQREKVHPMLVFLYILSLTILVLLLIFIYFYCILPALSVLYNNILLKIQVLFDFQPLISHNLLITLPFYIISSIPNLHQSAFVNLYGKCLTETQTKSLSLICYDLYTIVNPVRERLYACRYSTPFLY